MRLAGLPSFVFAFCASWLGPSTAWAEGPALAFSWRAPAACPARAAVLARIDVLAPARPTEGPPLVARAEVSAVGKAHFRLDLVTESSDGPGRRVLEAQSCAELAEATAVILAWALDPTAALSAIAGPPASSAAPAPVVPAGAEEIGPGEGGVAPGTQGPRGKARSIVFGGGLFLAADGGSVPGLTLGPGARVWIRTGPFRGGLYAASFAERTGRVEGVPDKGGHFALSTFAAEGCALLDLGPLTPALCGGAEVDRIGARGFGVPTVHDTSVTSVAAAAHIETSLRLQRHVRLFARGGAVFPVRRPSFFLDGYQGGAVFQPSPVVGRASAGVDCSF
jgi:hypothetical protein